MKFLPLVWAGLWRRPTRTVLTALSIVVAFLLLGLLEGVNAGFEQTIAETHREFLVTSTRVRRGGQMPLGAMDKIRSIGGVEEVIPRAYFMGSDREPAARYTVAALATEPARFFSMQPALIVSPESLEAIRTNRAGMLSTPAMLDYFGWKVGDRVNLRSDIVRTDGTRQWTFDIVGTFAPKRNPESAYFGVINYAYLDESRVENRGTAEIFYIRIADPTKAVASAAAIDRIFANSPHETRTRSQQERAELRAKQIGDVRFFTNAIMGAVLFTLAFLTGNTLRQSIQERIPEFAVLRALGYADGSVLRLAYAEALLLYVPPAIAGLVLALVLAPFAKLDFGRIVVSPEVALVGLGCASLLALLGVAVPAFNLARMPVVAALYRR
jgi:putative ABC transport system permease protein